jgi:hypothetical protein
MRKIIRICMIAVAAGGVFCYLAVSYALHHPESLLAQCTLTALHLGADYNPLYKVGSAVGRTAYRVATSESVSQKMTPEEEEQLLCVPPDPLPVQDVAPLEKAAVTPEQRDFILQTIKEELQRQAERGLPAQDHVASDSLTQTALRPVSQGEPPLAKEDDFPQTMPHCLDEEDAPDLMPPAPDSKSTSSSDPLFQFWLGLFESTVRESEKEPQSVHDEEPPHCLEDPTYQYQYPGCPFTGKCPYEERLGTPKISIPAVKPNQKPAPANSPPSPKRKAGKGMTDPKKYELPARLRQLVPGDSTEAQEEPAHPEVDTTEFRPSDARPGEFDPKPM